MKDLENLTVSEDKIHIGNIFVEFNDNNEGYLTLETYFDEDKITFNKKETNKINKALAMIQEVLVKKQ